MPTIVEPSTFDAQTAPPMDLDMSEVQGDKITYPESSNIINSGLDIPSDLPGREIATPTPQKPKRLLTPQQPQHRPNPSLQVEASQITSKPGTKRRLDSLHSHKVGIRPAVLDGRSNEKRMRLDSVRNKTLHRDGEDTREHEATESQVASVIEDMPHLPSREAVRSVPARRIPQISDHTGTPGANMQQGSILSHTGATSRDPRKGPVAMIQLQWPAPVNGQGGETTEPQGSGQSQNRSHSLARDAMHTKDDNPQPTHRSSTDKLTTSVLNRRAGGFFGGSSLNQLNTTSSSGNQAGISESGTIATIQVQSEYDLFTDESSIDDQEEPAEPMSPTSDDSIL
ncbi:hypothetical protein PG993_010685 [Apiospora rasikravindrae]|uniref:Uncharacterized protein n=1 Tax=Apiospora rasikravindrae TaxID=990691 RepID=A0ABR1SC41_9PEZI